MAESNKLVIRKIVVGRPISTALSSGTLTSLSDVSINGKQNGQGIFYNTAANRWENGTFTAGEGIDISWDSSANTLTFIAEYADSDNAGVAKFTSSDFSVDSVGKVDIKFNSLPESLIPASDSAYDLGSASKKWRSLYLSAGTIYLGNNKAISLDSSSGTLLFDGQSVLIAGSSASDSDIRNLFTASGGLSYNSSTGAFTDSDRTRSQILNLINVTGGGLSYNAATGTITDSDRSTSQIKGLFSATGGGLSYNSSTGVFTDSDRSTSQIKGLFSATGGGLTYNSSTGVFTDSDRSTAQIKGLFTASGGGLTYNSSTGAFTDSDRSRAQILGLHTGGTGITYNNSTGAISLTGDSNTFSGLTVTNNLTVSGNLVVAGTRTEVNTATLSVEDNIITLNSNVTGTPNTNAGIEVNRGNQNTKSIQWNETADKWYVESDGNGTFVTGLLETDSATIGGHPILTDNDGAFIKGLLSGSTGITYSDSTGAISITNTGVASATYGSSTAIPVFTVNAQGQIDSAGVVDVAGVNSASWDSASNRYRIALATGDNIDTTIGGFNNISFKSLSDSAQTVIRSQLNVVGSLSYDSATGQLSYTDSDRSAASIKGLFSATGGGLSYNSSTGVITDSDRTSAQIKGLFTVTGGGLSYNSSTGVITDSDRTANQIKELFTGGTGITFDSGAISLTGDSNTFSGLTVTNNLTVKGNLIVAGTRTEVNTAVLNIEDNIITLNSGTTGTPSENAGILVDRGNLISKSIQWNEGADKWYIESDGNGSLMTGLLEADSATIGGHPILTDNDGAFIKGLFSASGGGLSYNNSTGVFTDSDRSRAQILGMIQAGNGLNWSADSGLMTLSGHAYERYEYSATAGQVTFVDSDVSGKVLSYNTLASFITLNGVILDPSDYTASNGTSVVLASGTDSADILGVYAFNVNGVSDTVSATNGGTFQSNLVVSGSLTATTLVGAGTGITSLNGAVVMNAIKAVDSNGSGLNADTLDGQQGAYYRINVYNAAGTLLN